MDVGKYSFVNLGKGEFEVLESEGNKVRWEWTVSVK